MLQPTRGREAASVPPSGRPRAGALRRALLGVAAAGVAIALHAEATAQPALYRYADADPAVGEKLIREHACTACHVRRVGGDGSAIYRPDGRVDTPAKLRAMVETCSTQLNLSLFPEEIDAIAAVLQRDHYRFPAARAR